MRNTRGEPVEPTTGDKAKQAKAGHDAARGKDPADFQKDHHDRLCAIEAKLGIAHKADGMKSEDQGGSGKPVRARH